MITVVTPFQRIENLERLSAVIKGHADWTVLVDDPTLVFPDWITVNLYDRPPKRQGFCPSNQLFNEFISQGLDDDTQYMILCDDDSVEEGFFQKIPDTDVVITSMKRGQRVPVNGVGYGVGDLIASPDNIRLGCVGGEQMIVKGKILKDHRYGTGPTGDFEMIEKVVAGHAPIYLPDTYVLFNYFEEGRYDSYRPRPVILFVGDYYCAANPKMGKSEWEGNIWASLDSTGLANVGRFHMDKYFYTTGNRGDMALMERVRELKPDYIVLVMYKPLGSDASVINEATLDVLANYFKVKIISIWGDLEAVEQRELAAKVTPYSWKVIGTATKEITEGLGYTYMHVPKDPAVFNLGSFERNIDVVFSGSFGRGREERQKVLRYLLDNGINLVCGGSEGGDHFTTEEYADRYKKSKMAISFSQARGVNVVNARPFEAMNCGALLLEQDSPELAKLYTPHMDYVPWTDEVDLLGKIRYYLSNEKERSEIASSGYRKTQELYSAKTFWEKALNAK